MTPRKSIPLRGKPLSAERARRGSAPALSLPETPAGACVFENGAGYSTCAPAGRAGQTLPDLRDGLSGSGQPECHSWVRTTASTVAETIGLAKIGKPGTFSRGARAEVPGSRGVEVGAGEQRLFALLGEPRVRGQLPQRLRAFFHAFGQLKAVRSQHPHSSILRGLLPRHGRSVMPSRAVVSLQRAGIMQ